MASSGGRGLELVRGNQPELILLDIMMPEWWLRQSVGV